MGYALKAAGLLHENTIPGTERRQAFEGKPAHVEQLIIVYAGSPTDPPAAEVKIQVGADITMGVGDRAHDAGAKQVFNLDNDSYFFLDLTPKRHS